MKNGSQVKTERSVTIIKVDARCLSCPTLLCLLVLLIMDFILVLDLDEDCDISYDDDDNAENEYKI